MDTHFICLANSYKRGGRCIAGVEISIDNDYHWTVKRKADGSPKWIRPISQATEYGEIPEAEAHNLPLFSIVRLTEVTPCPQRAHSEDVHYKQIYSIGKIPAHPTVFSEMVDNTHPLLFYDEHYSISIQTYEHGNYSLMMVHPEELSFHLDPSRKRAKYFMTFKYNDVVYDFSVTDPDFYQLIEQHPDKLNSLTDVYLTLSLGLEYEGRHHKLIAAIIEPEPNVPSKQLFVIRKECFREISTRPFTSKERRACKRCFVVPCRQGLSLCMRMKDGKEQFIMIDEKSSVKPWDVISLKKALIVTYEDADSKEFMRIRILTSTKDGLLRRLFSFVFGKQSGLSVR
jgi:hypothetical protein